MSGTVGKKKIKVKIKKNKNEAKEGLPSDITDVFREQPVKRSLASSQKLGTKSVSEKGSARIKQNTSESEISIDKKENVSSKLSEPSIQVKTHKHEIFDSKQVQKTQESVKVSVSKEETRKEEQKNQELILKQQEVQESIETSIEKKKKDNKRKTHHHKTFKKEDIEENDRNKKILKQKENEKVFDKKEAQKKKEKPKSITPAVPEEITITESIQVSELAKKLNVRPNDVINKLWQMGEKVTLNQALDSDTAELVAGEFGSKVQVVSLYEETKIKEDEDKPEDRVPRPPVVTIMGHVDHGKTKLLDTIRRSNIVEKEAGAITQHIGAYQVTTSRGKITFLDTPGHEAFTAMRARGASVTDIVVLVVAADDGVKEQTVEAIHHAQAANVPIIVAINKIDLPSANPERVKQELVQYGLQPEEWGGDTIFCEISAKNHIGIDNLLDMILLQAEILELKANIKVKPVGRVIESKKDPGKGAVATILIQKGVLRGGMPFVVGIYSGKVRAMFNDYGKRIKEAGPSTPVEIIGIEGVPEPGDPFNVVKSEKEAREIASKRQYYERMSQAKSKKKQPSWKDLDEWTKEHKELKVIIKADVHGSVEAIKDGLQKLSTEEVKVNVIYGATGPITESDVNLAMASNALIVAFQVRSTPGAEQLAGKNHIEIKYYSIIYNLIEDIEKALKGMLEPQWQEVITGEAEVRQVFRISKVGNVAGCMVRKGKISRNDKVRLVRDGVVIYDGEVNQLKRFKEDVLEVAEGYECGISIKDYNDIKVGDTIEFYKVVEVESKV